MISVEPIPSALWAPPLAARRRILAALAAAVVVTLVAAVVAAQRWMWGVQVLVDLLLAAYVAMLIHVRNVSAGVEMSARTLGG